MTSYTTSCKPLAFYADGETPLEELVDKFGTRLEALAPYEKLILLAAIATNLGFHLTDERGEHWTIRESYEDLPSCAVTDSLYESLPCLDTLTRDSLLGLCEALVAQLRYSKEVA